MGPLFSSLFILLASVMTAVREALAQDAAAPAPPSFSQVFIQMLPAFSMCLLIFYFMVIRPREKKVQEMQTLIGGLKKGEQVVAAGGLIGRVASVEDDSVLLEISPNVKIRVETSSIRSRYEPKSQKKEGKDA